MFIVFVTGTPLHRRDEHSVERLVESCCKEAEIYSRLGLDSILVENMNDLPYTVADEVGPEITSSMAIICREVRKVFPEEKPVGKFVIFS